MVMFSMRVHSGPLATFGGGMREAIVEPSLTGLSFSFWNIFGIMSGGIFLV